MHRTYGEYAAHPQLRPYVACHWCFTASGGPGEAIEHHVLPDGCVSLAVRTAPALRPASTLAGPRVDPLVVEVRAGLRIWGTRFWPGGAAALLSLRDVADLRDSVVPCPSRLAIDVDAIARARSVPDAVGALEKALLPLPETARPDRPVMKAAAAIVDSAGDVVIADLVRDSGLAERTFQRRFRRAVGLTAKELARVRRMRAAAIESLERDGGLTDIAYQGGYADQAHMAREFRRLLGISPGDFRRDVREIEHGTYDLG